MREKLPSKPCPIPGCWQETPGGRPCPACRSWWDRLRLYSASQLSGYLQRQGRFAGRFNRLNKHGVTEPPAVGFKLIKGGRRSSVA